MPLNHIYIYISQAFLNGNEGILNYMIAANDSAQAAGSDASVLKQMHCDRPQINDASEMNGLDMENRY